MVADIKCAQNAHATPDRPVPRQQAVRRDGVARSTSLSVACNPRTATCALPALPIAAANRRWTAQRRRLTDSGGRVAPDEIHLITTMSDGWRHHALAVGEPLVGGRPVLWPTGRDGQDAIPPFVGERSGFVINGLGHPRCGCLLHAWQWRVRARARARGEILKPTKRSMRGGRGRESWNVQLYYGVKRKQWKNAQRIALNGSN